MVPILGLVHLNAPGGSGPIPPSLLKCHLFGAGKGSEVIKSPCCRSLVCTEIRARTRGASPHSGIKSSFSIAFICTTPLRVPVHTQDLQKVFDHFGVVAGKGARANPRQPDDVSFLRTGKMRRDDVFLRTGKMRQPSLRVSASHVKEVDPASQVRHPHLTGLHVAS
jgi:hypothetical protein